MNKRIHKERKFGYYASEKLASLSENQVHHLEAVAAQMAAERVVVVSAWAAKKVFKENASNPKIEEYLLLLLKTLTRITDGEISVNALAGDIEAMCRIKYNQKTGEWINLRRKEDVK